MMVKGLKIVEDDLSGAQIAALLWLHLDEMHKWSPAECIHAIPNGQPAPFLAARRLYEANGFAECHPCGAYVADDFSICMTRTL